MGECGEPAVRRQVIDCVDSQWNDGERKGRDTVDHNDEYTQCDHGASDGLTDDAGKDLFG